MELSPTRGRVIGLRLLWLAVVLALCGGGLYFCGQWGPSGRIAIDFLTAIERGDLAAAEAFVRPETDRPALSDIAPPSSPWHPVEILGVWMNDSPRDYSVTVAVTAAGRSAELEFMVGNYDEIVDVVQRAEVTVENGPADVSFAGTPYPESTGFGQWVLPGIYAATALHPGGGVSGSVIVPAADGYPPTLVLRVP